MSKRHAPELARLLAFARHTLTMSQEEMGQRFGASRKTVGRWETGSTAPLPSVTCEIIRATFAEDPDLAAEMATHVHESLVSLGLVAPPKPPEPPAAPPLAPPEPPVSPRHLVDSVVCAAAEAIDQLPRAVRPAVLAAFRRARELRLDVKTVEESLVPEVVAAEA